MTSFLSEDFPGFEKLKQNSMDVKNQWETCCTANIHAAVQEQALSVQHDLQIPYRPVKFL